jgi:hypothetical protein
MSADCNADYGHPCDVNDGQPCANCEAWNSAIEAMARSEWEAASPQERDPAKYEREMRDAGRGHLLP